MILLYDGVVLSTTGCGVAGGLFLFPPSLFGEDDDGKKVWW
jgi:hypothetical protein